MFNWKWNLSDIVQDKDVSVFSTFSCGGGSTMGYKRAGFKVLGNVEIDPRMNDIYIRNHHPKYNYCMDLREFNKLTDIPEELYHLDILDGSPPCSTFSSAGRRDEGWGKEKVFREGQAMQTLDDLFFVFIDTVAKLKPKIVIGENVMGLARGKAKGYVNEIIKRFRLIGYDVQLFQLNAAFMNVPQMRERVFFIANNQGFPKLKLDFNEKPILFGEIRSEKGVEIKGETIKQRAMSIRPGDICLGDVSLRQIGKKTSYTYMINKDDRVAYTLTANDNNIRYCDRMFLSDQDCINMSTFPQDYDFGNEKVAYVCGMSVPPNMMSNIAVEVYNQWLKPIAE